MKLFAVLVVLLLLGVASPVMKLLASGALFYIGLPLLLTWGFISVCTTKKQA